MWCPEFWLLYGDEPGVVGESLLLALIGEVEAGDINATLESSGTHLDP